MNCFILLRGPFVLLFVCLLWGDGWGAAAKVDCRAEAELLRSNEAELCNGFGYVFNPSACIRARKALASFTAGECRQPAARPLEPAPQATPVTKPALVTESQPEPAKISDDALVPDSDTDQLRREIAVLRAEVQQLRREVAAIRALQK